jgi:arylsulfatase A-like enzyme
VREVLRLLGRWLLRPSSVGAIYLLGMVALAARQGSLADEALAGQTRVIRNIVDRHFAGEVDRITMAIVAVTVVIGGLLGALAAILLRVRDRLARQTDDSPVRFAARVALVTMAIHALVEAHAMADAPQLYAEAWYARGGLPRLIQVLLTDDLGPNGVLVIGAATLLAFVAGPISQWKRWPSRLARAFLPFRRPRLRGAAVGTTGTVALLLGLYALHGPTPTAHAETSPPRPNILILAADSLRADRLDPRIAPNLSRLADKGARFDRAYVSLPRTFPSWVTLLTGRYPHHHGIRSMFPRWEDRTKDFDALPERLARAGYMTSVVSDFAGDIFDRIDLGWTHTHVPMFDFRELVRQRALERETPLLPFLQSRAGRDVFPVLREMNDAADPRMLADDAIGAIGAAHGQPFFLTVFFSTAHFPYAAPAPYYGRFTDASYRGRFKYYKPVGLEREAPPDDADIAQIRGLYDGCVASIDTAAEKILHALDRGGLAENTIVIVVADHGEALYENGHGAGHGDHLFGDEGTHVPLVVFDPRKPGSRRVETVVRDIDLAPTLYDLAGVAPPADLDGQSLQGLMSGAPSPPRLAFAETGLWFTEDIAGVGPSLRIPYPGIAEITEVDTDHHDDVVLKREMRDLALVAKHRMVRDERYKLVYAPTREGVKYLLFDTVNDPGETHDIASDRHADALRLQGDLWKWMLADASMEERGGYLVPRATEPATDVTPDAHVIRADPAGVSP